MHKIYSETRLHIDLDAVASNYNFLKNKVSPSNCSAVVKADAYGVGLAPVAKRLWKERCREFFVANLEEGVMLRNILPDSKIYVFHGSRPSHTKYFVEYNLVPVLNHHAQLEEWVREASSRGKILPAVIHVDTGMNRLGFSIDELENLYDSWDLDPINLKYVMSHLACSTDARDELNKKQLESIIEVRNKYFLSTPAALSNSWGIFLGKEYHLDLVRTGTALYGINSITDPYDHKKRRQLGLKDAVTLTAPIIQIRKINKICTVGYDGKFQAKPGDVLATVPIGYADGYFRQSSGKAFVAIDGKQVPIVGRVSMDMIILDISSIPEHKYQIGTEVEILGKNINVDMLADWSDTIGYNVLTNLGNRFYRVYKGEET